jgi:hypothetical protein
MPILAIETATALVGRERRGEQILETQLLELEGCAPDGRAGRACLIFSQAVEPARTAAVGYLTEAADGALVIVGWLPEADYPAYRGILAEGRALELHFETRDPTTGYLRRLALGRRTEALIAATPGTGTTAAAPRRETAFAMPL